MTFTVQKIIEILSPSKTQLEDIWAEIEYLSIDSRHLSDYSKTLFFCFDGTRIKSIALIPELIKKGIQNIVIDKKYCEEVTDYSANFIFVENVTEALQKIALYKRNLFTLNVIGITGSNGKTIVKEWLYQLLSGTISIVKSPKSYNSQVGVPLSVWNITKNHSLGIFEAGISQKGEMQALRTIIQPQIGLLTNIGEAHNEGFIDKREKLKEKLSLFIFSKVIIYNFNDLFIRNSIGSILKELNCNAELFGWGKDSLAQLNIKLESNTLVVLHNNSRINIPLSSTEPSYVENSSQCIATLVYLNYNLENYKEKIFQLNRLEMRLELIEGIHQSILINDTYNSDLNSLKIALNFLTQQSKNRPKTLILSDIFQSTMSVNQLSETIIELLKPIKLNQLILIGSQFYSQKEYFNTFKNISILFYLTTEDFLIQFSKNNIKDQVVLVKGSRSFEFEKIIKKYQKKTHETYLQINLNALKNNLNQFATLVKPQTKIMLMLKAQGYGLGSVEIAKLLEHQRADYFAVAYTDEGVELRNAGVQTPIMIVNPEINALEKMIEHSLEPEIYSLTFFKKCIEALKHISPLNLPKIYIHIKLETGMNRLGINENEIEELILLLNTNKQFVVKSIFSHLAASDESEYDYFTINQMKRFEALFTLIEEGIGYSPLKHILNSQGIARHSEYQYDMVRLGIGLFGFDASLKIQHQLQNTVSLISKIAQIKQVELGETIGYARNGKISRNTTIGIINLGYADGYSRIFGNGKAMVYIKGHLVPTIGNICMDMIMIDITGIENIYENDEVELFGDHISIATLADIAKTIPYEILTSVSSRVQRVYFEN